MLFVLDYLLGFVLVRGLVTIVTLFTFLVATCNLCYLKISKFQNLSKGRYYKTKTIFLLESFNVTEPVSDALAWLLLPVNDVKPDATLLICKY